MNLYILTEKDVHKILKRHKPLETSVETGYQLYFIPKKAMAKHYTYSATPEFKIKLFLFIFIHNIYVFPVTCDLYRAGHRHSSPDVLIRLFAPSW